MTSAAHECLTDALAAAKIEFAPVIKDKTATVKSKKEGARDYTYKYADLSDVIEAVEGALTKHGIVQIQRMKVRDGMQLLVSELRFKSEVVDSEMVLPIEGLGPQDCGRVISYFRRYALQALLGITAERDDDAADTGHVRQPPARRPEPPPRTRRDAEEAVPLDEGRIAKCRKAVEREISSGVFSYSDPAAGTLSQPFATADEACSDLLDVMAESPPGWVAAAMRANEPLVNAAGDGIAREMASLHMRKNGGAAASEGAPK